MNFISLSIGTLTYVNILELPCNFCMLLMITMIAIILKMKGIAFIVENQGRSKYYGMQGKLIEMHFNDVTLTQTY